MNRNRARPWVAEPAARRLYAMRWGLLIVAAILFGVTQPLASQLQMDRRIDQMFPASDPAVDAYRYLNAHFGGNAIVLLVYADAELFTEAGVDRADQIGTRVRDVPGVLDTLTVADVSSALDEIRSLSLFGSRSGRAILESNDVTNAFRELFAGYTHNDAGDHAAIVVMLEPDSSAESYGPTIERIGQIAADLPAPLTEGVLVGQPVLVTEGYTLIERDGRRLSGTTVWLLSLVLLLLFRSPRWVLAALLVIFWSSVVTRGCAVWWGLQLSLVSSMLTAILTVVAVAAIIHVAVGWLGRRRRGDSVREATERTLARLTPPILWAGLTDAAGFAALLASSVGPVRDFGLLMTLGVGVVLLGLLLILPAAMAMPLPLAGMPLGRRVPATSRFDRWLQGQTVRVTAWLLTQRVKFLWLTGLIGIATLIGLTRLTAETNFLRNFRSTSSITTAYRLVEHEFGGAGVWDVLVPAPPQAIGGEYLDSVRELEAKLLALEVDRYPQARILKTLSLADADAAAASSSNPIVRFAIPEMRLDRMSRVMPTFARALLMPPQEDQARFLRIMLRSPEDLSTEAKTGLIRGVEQTVAEHTTSDHWRALIPGTTQADEQTGMVTGYYVLLARLVDSLLSDQWKCLGLAALAVWVALWLATRSLTLASLTMIPNLLPVLATLAVLGWSQIPLNMGGAMIAAVSIGLTIDGSIHFLAQYRRTRQRYRRLPSQAVLKAQSRVGIAIVLSTVSLVAGFSVLTTSEFIPTATFGWLLSIAMLLGMLANLLLLPILLAKPAASSGS